MIFQAKPFNNLSLDELYSILRLRNTIFIVEQNCVYQDIDSKDQEAIHVIGKTDDEIVAYTRCFRSGAYFKEASIGRVLVKENHRNEGIATELMQKSINVLIQEYQPKKIKISAQTYLKKFYTSLGFQQEGKEYMEDGIPHIAMILEVNKRD